VVVIKRRIFLIFSSNAIFLGELWTRILNRLEISYVFPFYAIQFCGSALFKKEARIFFYGKKLEFVLRRFG
jgi:hypothetical protein